MKDLKKNNIIRTVLFFSMFWLSLTAGASAQDDRTCALASLAGQWGTSGTGTLILPTGPIPLASVARFTRDAEGNFSGTQTTVVGGKASEYTIKGTTAVNSDCTGTLTWGTYDQSGNLVNTTVFAVVWVDNEREARVVATSLVLANGMSLPAVLTGTGKRQFPGREQ